MTPGVTADRPHDGGKKGVLAIVPFRCPQHGKSRLRRWLDGPLCDELAFAMYADVVVALRASRIPEILTVTHGVCGAPAARAVGSPFVIQPSASRGLNGALKVTERQRCGPILVVTADLPRLTPGAVALLHDNDADVVVAPSRDGGTAALLLRRPGIIPVEFGGRSGARHFDAARRAGLTAAFVEHPAYDDVDTPDDLLRLAKSGQAGRATEHVLDRWRAVTPRSGRSRDRRRHAHVRSRG